MATGGGSLSERAVAGAERAISVLGSALMLVMTFVTFGGVLLRYVFHSTIPWGEEIARWVLVWVVFGGQAYAFVAGAHVGVEVVVRALPRRWQGLLNVLQYLISIAAFLIIGFYGYKYMARSIATQQLAPGSRLPLALPQSAIPVGSALAIAALIIKLVKDRRG